MQEVEKLRDRVSKQSVNKEDIERLLNEKCDAIDVFSLAELFFRQKLEQMFQNALSHKAAVEREVNDREVQRDGLLNQLEKCVHGYHNHARMLKLIPIGSKHSVGVDFAIHVDRHVGQFRDICTADHKARSCLDMRGQE